MELGLIVSLAAGAVAGLLAGAELKFVDLGRFGALIAGMIGGGAGLGVASQIAANPSNVGIILPGGADAAIAAIVAGGLGGAAMVATLGVVKALLAEG